MINLEYKTLDNLIENELKMQTQRFEQKQQEIINNSLEEKDKEIERLNKECDTYMKIATKRGNIIDELEKDLEEKIDEDRLNILSNSHWKYVLDKLKELKESK